MSGLKAGDIVILPAGSRVHSLRKGASDYVTKRRQKIKIHHFIPASELTLSYMEAPSARQAYPAYAEQFAKYDELMLDARTNPDRAAADAAFFKAMSMRIQIKQKVVWAGGGGRWNDADAVIPQTA